MRPIVVALFALLLSACGDDGLDPSTGQPRPDEPPIPSPSKTVTDGCQPEKAPGPAPTQTVTFSFSGSADVWVPVEGSYCKPFAISDANGASLSLQEPYSVRCEGMPPPPSAVREAVHLRQRPQLSWAAGSLSRYLAECYSCDPPWTGMGVQKVFGYAPVAVPPGRYRATLALLAPRHDGCFADGDKLHCSTYDYSCGAWCVQQPLCPSERTVTVDFELPSSGSITVPVVVD